MTIDEWRKSKSLTRWWSAVLNTDEGRALKEMMEDSHIRHLQNRGISEGVELGQNQGYDLAVNNFMKAAELLDIPGDPGQPTYEAEEEETGPRRKKAK